MPPRGSGTRQWIAVDDYFSDQLARHDEGLDAALQHNQDAGLPAIDVSPLLGRFLEVLARIAAARRILEIGTLGGYSTIWLARALPEGGQVVSLELNPRHAKVARANLRKAGVLERVDLRVGRAMDSLAALLAAGVEPFDMIFIDADKSGYPEYLDWALKLARPGTIIVADNVVRNGKVIQAGSTDPDVQGVRRFTEKLASEPSLRATVLQTVGIKEHDGFAVAVVLG